MAKDSLYTIALNRAKLWLEGPYDEATKAHVQALIDESSESLLNAFGSPLSFGTGGLRALMGVGDAKLNTYTIATATQGLANFLNKTSKKSLSVVVGFDSRHHSKEFAKMCAEVLTGNGIKVYLFKEIRPTPFISFACRHLQADAAVMITASHNPKEYNGYKVYGKDGGQVVFPHDQAIIEEVRKVQGFGDVKQAKGLNSLIELIGDELDAPYLQAIAPLQLFPKQNQSQGKSLKIAYTSLHGCGITIVPKALKSWGFDNICLEPIQTKPDGDFPTVSFPNPEIKEALSLGVKLMTQENCDILIATDPDSDRLGIVINDKGAPFYFTGNQIASICLYYLLQNKKEQGSLLPSHAVISTIVTTRLLKKLCEAYHISYIDVLTGFKYIAEKIDQFDNKQLPHHFLFGAEESYGYLYGEQARDKDAIILSCLIAEIALHMKTEGKTLKDLLFAIYEKQGVFLEGQKTLNFEASTHGMQAMQAFMQALREKPLTHLEKLPVIHYKDYLSKENTTLPKADVLEYHFEEDTVILIRPSGTEPKVKIYAGVCELQGKTIEEKRLLAAQKLEKLLCAIQAKLQTTLTP